MITIQITPEQLAILDKALQQMPYGMVAPLIADINRQLQEKEHGNEKEQGV